MNQTNKTVTAFFVLKSKPINYNIQQTKNLLNGLDGNKYVLVIDVSNTSDYANSHMLCAKNYVWNSGTGNFATSTTNLNNFKNDDILIYDQTGTQSQAAANKLAEQGFQSVYYMTDGLDDWMAEGYEVFASGDDGSKCTSLAPMAYAGNDLDVNEKGAVAFNGQGSDPGGGSVSYEWSQEEGANKIDLTGKENNPQLSFTAPDLNGGADKLIFHLTVTDNEGDNDTDSVTVNIKWVNEKPTAMAGPDQKVTPGSTVTLDGSGSSDPENSIISYFWSISSSQINPSPILSDPSAIWPTFIAPNVTRESWIILELRVTDNGVGADQKSDTDTVKITVQPEVVDPNDPPQADAGANQTVTEGQTVTLNSTGSSDPDGNIVSRTWTQTGGAAAVTLSDPSVASPTFTAPDVSADTTLTFILTVTDDDGDTDTDTVQIIVQDDDAGPEPNTAPVADAGEDQSAKEGGSVVLDGSGSTDSDGTIAGYAWTQTDSTGITVTLSDNSSIKPTFIAPDVENTIILTFSLVVTDDDGATSSADPVRITITKKSSGGGGDGCFIDALAD